MFQYRLQDGRPCDALQWVDEWEPRYPSKKYREEQYTALIDKAGILSSKDFLLIGRWKDYAWSDEKWRSNVSTVAFAVWHLASVELPGFRIKETSEETFLVKWAEYRYPDASSRSTDGKKAFGLSRATTLLHFITEGRFPIFDSNVRKAIRRLCGKNAPNRVQWYLSSYMPLFRELVRECNATSRRVDKALFAYGRQRRS